MGEAALDFRRPQETREKVEGKRALPLGDAVLDFRRTPGRWDQCTGAEVPSVRSGEVPLQIRPQVQALVNGEGWVDLFSGSRGFAKALAEAAPWWILCVDWKRDADEDMRDCELQDQIEALLRSGRVRGFSADPPAGSFSSAVTPPWRTKACPEGASWLTAEARKKVRVENLISSFCARLAGVCEAERLLYWVANPERSRMWRMPEWRGRSGPSESFVVDFCRFGTSWKKATRFVTNGQLAGQKLLCQRACSASRPLQNERDHLDLAERMLPEATLRSAGQLGGSGCGLLRWAPKAGRRPVRQGRRTESRRGRCPRASPLSAAHPSMLERS